MLPSHKQWAHGNSAHQSWRSLTCVAFVRVSQHCYMSRRLSLEVCEGRQGHSGTSNGQSGAALNRMVAAKP